MLKRHWTKNNTFDLSSYSSLNGTHGFAVASGNRLEKMSTPVFEYAFTSVGNLSLKTPVNAFVKNSQLHLSVNQPENVIIYSISGVVVYQARVDNELIISLQKGVYLIRINEKTTKVIL